MSTVIEEPKKARTGLSQLEQLKKFTKVVADTADFESMRQFQPQDATTNPSLVLAATQKEQYGELLNDVLRDRRLNHRAEVVGGILAEECGALLQEFFVGVSSTVAADVASDETSTEDEHRSIGGPRWPQLPTHRRW